MSGSKCFLKFVSPSPAGLLREATITPRPQFWLPPGAWMGPLAFANPLRLGSGAKCPIDTGLAELGTPDDLRDCCTVFPQGFHLINHWKRK